MSALAAVVPLRSTVRWAALLPSLLRYFGAVLVTVRGGSRQRRASGRFQLSPQTLPATEEMSGINRNHHH